jgi:hypothetical protein
MTEMTPNLHRHLTIAESIALLLIGIAFFCLNHFTWLYCDDYPYAFCITDHGLDLSHPISGLKDVITSQYQHFLHSHGRILAIGLDQWFIGLRTKLPFNLCNTLIFMGYIWLMQKVARRRNWTYSLLIFVLLMVCLRAFGQVFLWMTGSLNYLWAGFINLLFLLVLRKQIDSNNLLHGLPCLLLALAAGWWQESFSVGIVATMALFIIYRLRHHQPIARVPLLMAVAYLIGFIIILASPGNAARARDEGVFEGSFLHYLDRNFTHVILGVRIIWLFVFTAVIQYFRHKLNIRQFFSDNSFLLSAIGIELLFLFILGPAAEARAFFGVETLALILLLRLLPEQPHKAVGIVLPIIAIAAYWPIAQMSYRNHIVTQAFLKEMRPTDGTVFFDLPQYSRTQRHYLGSLLVTDHRSKLFYTEAAYYGKKRLIVLPRRLKEELYETTSFLCPEHLTPNGEYTTPDIHFTIKPIPRGQEVPLGEKGCEYVSFPTGNYRLKNKHYVHDGLWATKR